MRPLRLTVTERTFITAQPERVLSLLTVPENISLVDPTIHGASWSLLGLRIGAPIEYRRGHSGIRLSSSSRHCGIGLDAAVWIKPFAHSWSDVLYTKRIECPLWALPLLPFISQSIRRTLHHSLRQLERNAERLMMENRARAPAAEQVA